LLAPKKQREAVDAHGWEGRMIITIEVPNANDAALIRAIAQRLRRSEGGRKSWRTWRERRRTRSAAAKKAWRTRRA